MSDQPLALWLAEVLMSLAIMTTAQRAQAAIELRRLHQFAEDQIGRATAAEAALQMTKATHALKIAAVEAQRDALQTENERLREALFVAAKAELFDPDTGIIDADVLQIVQDVAKAALRQEET